MTISKTPWQYNAQHMAVYDVRGRAVAKRPDFSSCAAVTEAADMQLIAAAPDLLQALHDVDAYLAPEGDEEDIYNYVRAIIKGAISKAQGA